MAKMRFRARLRAWFDATMDRGTPALIGWLALASLVLILLVTGLVIVLTPGDVVERNGWHTIIWMSLLRAVDPGTMGADSGTAPFLALMLLVTIGGIFVVSSLIGVLTAGLENRIAELRKGRSKVIEKGHSVILGWSDQVFIVISELVKAQHGRRRGAVVILAAMDKVVMEDQIRSRVGDTGRMRIICRSGSPLKPADLELVNPDAARSIMVISPPSEDADIDVIKALLLLKHRTWTPVRPHVVAAIQETENMPAAKLAAGEHAQLVDADDIAVRLVVQSHRIQGLAAVCTDLLDFSGNEIYMKAEPALVGVTYGDALLRYAHGCPIGLRRAAGGVEINPPGDSVIAAGDEVIVIAEDDLLIRLAEESPAVFEDALVNDPSPVRMPDRTLLVGWNSRGEKILDLLDRLVEQGSTVDVAAPAEPAGVLGPRAALTVAYRQCDPTSRRSLELLEPAGYRHIVVLADESVTPDRADDRTLVTLLHLRDIEENHGDPYSIVTEMNDDANREIAQVTAADDFIVSSKLISLLMTQLAENRHLHSVFAELFDPSGSEIYLKPAHSYATTGVELNFATVVESARRRRETAIGYFRQSQSARPPAFGVILNPPKTAKLTLNADDAVIVIALE
jgi:voltage-gated potassium channel Kch